MAQRLAPFFGAPLQAGPPSGPLPARQAIGRAVGIGLLLLLSPVLASGLRAQDRSTLQVAAQVVSTAPSQFALAAGLAAVNLGAEPVTQSLASVEVASPPPKPGVTPDAMEPRTVVTISFLRN